LKPANIALQLLYKYASEGEKEGGILLLFFLNIKLFSNRKRILEMSEDRREKDY